MKSYHFTIVVQQDEEGNFLALCPAMQGCYAEGETREDAISYLEDVIKLHLEDRIQRGEVIYEEVFSERITVAA